MKRLIFSKTVDAEDEIVVYGEDMPFFDGEKVIQQYSIKESEVKDFLTELINRPDFFEEHGLNSLGIINNLIPAEELFYWLKAKRKTKLKLEEEYILSFGNDNPYYIPEDD